MNNVNSHFEDFDEATYLKLNPDVLEAVKSGVFSSGWHHYVLHGYRENRSGIFPPEHLRKRVHGGGDISSFKSIGKILSFDIYSAIKSLSISMSCILDFGCGCGRVIRYFHNLYDKSDFYGTDIDKEAISWCKSHLSYIGKFITNEDSPPLPFADGFFDFVYSISIFTHLPEDMQFVWLEELRRVTKRDGYLLLTVHGAELFPVNSEEKKEKFMKSGFYYLVGAGTEGLPNFYQTVYHTEDYIVTHWSNFFEIKRIIKKGVNDHQDVILCRRK